MTATNKSTKATFSVIGLLFGLFFAGLGLLFVALVLHEFFQTLETYRWKSVPVVVDELTVDYPTKAPRSRDNNVFTLNAKYHYQYEGRNYEGTRLRLDGGKRDGSYERLALLRRELLRNELDRAFVDPNTPSNAILQRGSLWFGLVVLFPLIFVAIGTLVIVVSLGLFQQETKPVPLKQRKRDVELGRRSQLTARILFGFVFFTAGVLAMYFLVLRPFWRNREASGWIETPCKVVWSRVEEHDGDDSTTYSVDVFYEYKLDDEVHRSNRYSFFSSSTSRRRAKQQVVAKYPRGLETTCFVSPDVPEKAVLVRGLKQMGWWWLFPIPFIVIGLSIMVGALRGNT